MHKDITVNDPLLRTISSAVFWVSLPFGILHFVLPIYGNDLGAGALQIGLIFSVFFLTTVVLRPFVGAGLDRFGRRPFFIAGLLTYGISMFAFAIANQFWGLITARILQGIASSLLWLSAQAITADVSPETPRGEQFGSVDQSGSRGAIMGGLIGYSVFWFFDIERGW